MHQGMLVQSLKKHSGRCQQWLSATFVGQEGRRKSAAALQRWAVCYRGATYEPAII